MVFLVLLSNPTSLLPFIEPAAAQSSSLAVSGVNISSLEQPAPELLQKAGIVWIRADVGFDQRFQDMYSIANRYALKFIGILDYVTLDHSAFTLVDWNRTVTKAQATYPLIHVWEIWNEPTLTQFQLGYMDGTPQHYFDMLKSAYLILKRLDSDATVLALSSHDPGPDDLPFANSVFSLGGGAYMDAISVHAYPYRLNAGQTWDYYKQLWTQELQQYRGFGKGLWITETGLQASQLTETDQANFLKDSYAFFQQQGAFAYMWYDLRDYSTSESWGVLRADLTTRPSYAAYVQQLSSLHVTRRS
jgi:hypothetical protein